MDSPTPPTPYLFAYPDLPILEKRKEILEALAEHRAIVVQGGTGSGKTTQLPKFLLEAGYAEKGLIGVTQPRRIAALSITDRLRQETQRPELIGSRIRFHDDVPPGAKVKVMTDGILLQEFRRDPLMRRYSCIILDEAHERSLNVDILLGIFKGILPRRKDFRLVVTSATLDAGRFAEFLAAGGAVADPSAEPRGEAPKAPVVEVEGRQHPVSIEYWDPQDTGGADDPEGEETPSRAIPPVEAAYIAITDLQKRRPDNLLCFLPTEKEIHELHRELERDLGRGFEILPLYSRLGPADQKKVFQEGGRPRIILATNIAETSLTIPGIGYVVDTGLARISRYHAQTKIQGLPIERISQASARQRAGRAGRVKPGVCIRLYGEAEFAERPAFTEPEILRSNLANVVLQLLALGLPVESFPFPDPPAPAALKGAFRQLHELGAVDGPGLDASLTGEGLKLSRLPVDVALGRILLKAADYGVIKPAVILAAGVTVQDPRFLPKEEPERQKAAQLHRRFEDPRSDFIGLLALWIWIHKEWDSLSQRRLRRLCLDNHLSYNRVREWMDLAEQFSRLLKVSSDYRALQLQEIDADSLHKSILSGFLPFLARRRPEEPSYRLAGDKEAFLHPGSSLARRRPEWIVAAEVRQTSRTFIYRACEIKPAWVEEIAPEACKRTYFNVAWNPERGFVEAVERVSYKGFAIRQDRRVNYEGVAPEECAEIFWREGAVRAGSGAPFPFRDRNQRVLDTLAGLERKARVRGLVPDEEALVHWYRSRAPGVTSKVRLERLLSGDPGSKPSVADAGRPLEFSVGDWAEPLASLDWRPWLPVGTAPGPSGPHPLERMFPDALACGGRTYPVSYRFDHGDPGDGISLETDLDGLAGLSVPDLFRGIPGWRSWIWEWALDRLPAKTRQQALEKREALIETWSAALGAGSGPVGSAPSDASRQAPPTPSPAAALAGALSGALDGTGLSLSFPAAWPSYLAIHVYVQSPTGRRFLVHVDPAMGDAELFAAIRRLAFGEGSQALPWASWSAWAALNHGRVPPPLPWRDMAYGAAYPGLRGPSLSSSGSRSAGPVGPGTRMPAAEPGRAGGKSGEGGKGAEGSGGSARFFTDLDEARFHARLAGAAFRAGADASRSREAGALADFFTRRIQSLLDAWSVPPGFRQETSALREFLCERWLPAQFLGVYGAYGAEGREAPGAPGAALARAEKELPPIRAALPKAGSQVKSLSALGQAVSRGTEPGHWVGAALALASAFVSRPSFVRWFAFFAQPPLQARPAIASLSRAVAALPDWEELLASPWHAAWAASALEDTLPLGEDFHDLADEASGAGGPMGNVEVTHGGEVEFGWAPPGGGGLDGLRARWTAAKAREEAIRKGSKAARDALVRRLSALGQAPGGLPGELRQALEVLDQGGPWGPKVEAALALEIHANKVAGRAGGAAANPAAPAKADPALEARKEELMKGLSGRFRRL